MNKEDVFDGFSIELFRDEDGDWLAHFEEIPWILHGRAEIEI